MSFNKLSQTSLRWESVKKFNALRGHKKWYIKRQSHCTHNTHYGVGFTEIGETKICQISYEDQYGYLMSNDSLFDEKRVFPDSVILASDETILETGPKKAVQTTKTYCLNSGFKMYSVNLKTDLPKRESLMAYSDYMARLNFPVQHLIFTNEVCGTLAE